MKNSLLLFSLMITIGLTSCSKSNELVVSSDDVQLVQIYVDEANVLIDVAGEIDGNVSAIFNTSGVTTQTCEGEVHDTKGGMEPEVALLMEDMIEKMGFVSTIDIHNWMVRYGKKILEIRNENKENFDTDREIMTALACLVIPKITTRNGSSACYKDNLVNLFTATLTIGIKYGSLRKSIDETECYSKGSSFNKIWTFMKKSYDCK